MENISAKKRESTSRSVRAPLGNPEQNGGNRAELMNRENMFVRNYQVGSERKWQ